MGRRRRGQTSAVHPRCEEHEGHPIGVRQDRVQYRTPRSGQNDVEFHVGQDRATSQQDPSGGIQRPSNLPSFPGYRHPGCASRVHHQRPPCGSPLSASRQRHPRVPQSQYLRGLFHHLTTKGLLPPFFSTHQQRST